MESEAGSGVRIQILSSEMKAARLAYSEESSEKKCYDKELSKAMMKKVSKTTQATTSVTITFEPEDIKSVLRMVHRHAKHMGDTGNVDKEEDYLHIYNKMERQAVYQGLSIR